MAVTVRLFAALREAAGASTVEADPAPLPTIVADLCDRFGEPFTTRVGVATGLLDGTPVRLDSAIDVPDGAELALLPPFSGGATGSAPAGDGHDASTRERRVRTLLLVGSLLVPALFVLAALIDRAAVGVAVAVVAVGSLIDLHVALAATGVRTVLPGGLMLVLGPVLVLLLAPGAAQPWLPGLVAIGLMVTFLLALASQRRHETALIVGSTALSGLLVAFGAGALLLLVSALQPARFTALLILVACTDAAAVIASRAGERPRLAHLAPAAAAVAIPVAIVVQITAGWAGTVVPVVGLALVAVVSAVAGARLRQVLRRPDVIDRPRPALLIGTADATLFAMPLTALWLQLLSI